MRAVIIGAVESTRIAIDALARAPGWELAAVLTLPARLAARHSDFVDLAPAAAAAGASVIEAADGNAPQAVAAIEAVSPEIGFVVGWSQICRPPLVAAAGGRMVGYHPAPLPRLRGRAAIPWTILLAEPITAGTLFYVDEGIDSGPILAQRFFHVGAAESATSLYARHMTALEGLMTDALEAVLRGDPGRPQDDQFATYAARRTEADGEIDWTRPADEIARLVRAVTRPYPGAFTHSAKGRLTCWSATAFPESARHAAAPGQVITLLPTGPVIMCGDGRALMVTDCEGNHPSNHERLGRRP